MPRESAFPRFLPQSRIIPASPWPLALAMAIFVGWSLWIFDGGSGPNGAGWFGVSAWSVAVGDHVLRYWSDVRGGYVPANPMWFAEKNTLHHFGVFFLLGTLLFLIVLGPLHVHSVRLWAFANWSMLVSGNICIVDWAMLAPALIWWTARKVAAFAITLSHRGHP